MPRTLAVLHPICYVEKYSDRKILKKIIVLLSSQNSSGLLATTIKQLGIYNLTS